MADGYIERQQRDYEQRKAEWQKKTRCSSTLFWKRDEES